MEDPTNKARSTLGSIVALFASIALALTLLGGCTTPAQQASPESTASAPCAQEQTQAGEQSSSSADLAEVPDYSGQDYIVLNDDRPTFSEADWEVPDGTEIYGELDALGRATGAFAKLCENTRPAKGSTRAKNMPDPSGFVQAKYPQIGLDHLYERSHLIAYSLSDEAVNPLDLITGTEHLNHDVMAKFEDQIRDYLNAGYTHKRHVLMRVTPDFRGDDLVARGVQIEALSLEDNGASVCLNVYCYNIQPGVVIDYATGKSRLGDPSTNNPLANNAKTNEQAQESTSAAEAIERSYVLNTNTKRFHYPDCSSVDDMKAKNRSNVTDTREHLIEIGYKPCARCNP